MPLIAARGVATIEATEALASVKKLVHDRVPEHCQGSIYWSVWGRSFYPKHSSFYPKTCLQTVLKLVLSVALIHRAGSRGGVEPPFCSQAIIK